MKNVVPTNIKASKYIIISKIILHVIYSIYTIMLLIINTPDRAKDEYMAKLIGEQTGHLTFYALPLVLLWLFFFSKKYYLTLIITVILTFTHLSNNQPPVLTIILLLLLITKESKNWFKGIVEDKSVTSNFEKIDTEILDR